MLSPVSRREWAPITNCPLGQVHKTEPVRKTATARPGRTQHARITTYPCLARRHAHQSTSSIVKVSISAKEKFAANESAAQIEAPTQVPRSDPPSQDTMAIAAIQNPRARPYPLAATR